MDKYVFIRKSGAGIKSCDWFFYNYYLSNGQTFLWLTVQTMQAFSYYQPGVYVLTLFLPHPSTPAPAVGIRSLHISRWTGGKWGPLDKEAARPCSSVFLFFNSVCLSVFPSVSALWFVLFFFCLILCYHQSQLCQPRLLRSSNCLIFLVVLIGRLWEKQLRSDIHFSFKWPQFFWEQLWSSSSKTPLLHVGPSGKCLLHQGIQPCPPSPASQLFSIFCPVSAWRGSCRLQDLWVSLSLCVVCRMSMHLDTDVLLLQQHELEVSLVWKMLVSCTSPSQQPICPANSRGSYQCKLRHFL